MNRFSRNIFISFCVIFLQIISFHGFCQLQITKGLSATQLVNNLVGPGIIVSNPVVTGSNTTCTLGTNTPVNTPCVSYGAFTNGNTTNLGLNSGIILSATRIDSIPHPQTYFLDYTLGVPGDADLDAINTTPSFDACILEFDFIPLSDTIKFRYVFGSEEYPKYVCAVYNDIFAFFITGPNPAGGNYNKYNIALIPGTTLPVSINSVNNGIVGVNAGGGLCNGANQSLAYSSLYVDNVALNGQTIAFGGFTVPLTAWCKVVPCKQYHMKLAVADGYNGRFDSGVFLEANSFTSNSCVVNTTYSNPVLGNNAIEGCTNGIFSFVLSNPTTTPYTINYTISGTAINGTDYTTIPTSVTIPAGSDSASVVISPLTDGIVEPTETVIITYTVNCVPQSDTLFIIDNPPIVTTTAGTTTVCPNTPSSISVSTTGGTPPLAYSWDNGAGTSSSATVSPAGTTTYNVTVTDFCGQTATDFVTITVSNNLPVTITPVNPTICLPGSVTLTANVTANSYSWDPATGLSSITAATVTANPTTTTTYTVTATSGGCSGSASVTVNVNPLSATITSTDENCGNSNGTATVTPTGTCTPNFTYSWNTIPPQTSQTATSLPANTYTVTVSCGACTFTTSATINNLPGPSVTITSFTNSTCGQPNGSAVATASNGSSPYSYVWSNAQTGQNLSQVAAGTYTISAYDANACVAVNTVSISNTPGPASSILSTTDASCGKSDGAVTISVVGGTASYTFNWNSTPPQTNQNLQNVPSGNYMVTVTDANGCTSTSSVFVDEKPGPSVTASSVNELCYQANGTATAAGAGGLGTYSYIWSNGQTTQTATGLIAGTYTVTVSDGGCTASSTVTVAETPGPTAAFTEHPSVLTLLDGAVNFLDHSTPGVISWEWTFGDGAIGNGVTTQHQYNTLGTYIVYLMVTDANGCKDTIMDSVVVKEIFTFYVPNSFTPDDDELNDVFTAYGINVDPNNFQMYIFNRWGNQMFFTEKWLGTHAEPWNGTMNNSGTYDDVVPGVYVYRIKLKELEGPSHEYIGKITLVR